MLASKYLQTAILLLFWVCPAHAQKIIDISSAAFKNLENQKVCSSKINNSRKGAGNNIRLQKSELKRVQNKLIKKMNRIYREIIAAYKANRFDYAHEKMLVFEELLDPNLLPNSYFKRMTAKLNSARKWMQRYYQKVQMKKRRAKEDKLFDQLQLSAQKKFMYPSEAQPAGPVRPVATSETTPNIHARKDVPTLVKGHKQPPNPRDYWEVNAKSNSMLAGKDIPKQSTPAGPLKKDDILIPEMAKQSGPDMEKERLRSQKKEYIYKVHDLYKDGLFLFRKGLYAQSLKVFAEVDKVWPDYKFTQKYIKLIHSRLASPNESQIPESQSRESVINKNLIIHQTLDDYMRHAMTEKENMR